jgi:ribosomal protein S18 acetylase RimI-like enzyme
MLVLKYLQEGNLLAEPSDADDFAKLFRLRWEVLRKPWGQEKGSEQDGLENSSIHRMVSLPGKDPFIVACGRVQAIAEGLAQIRYMAVKAEYQGKGWGVQVLQSLEEAALEAGLKEVFLHARDPAVPFYLRTGYRLEEEIDPYLGIRHFRMRKLLG